MRRSAQCIRMLQLLRSRGLMGKEELAQELDTNKRNVIEYKKELEDAGYRIESISGRYGGYRLLQDQLFPVLCLSDEESKAIGLGYEFMKSHPDFLMLKEFGQAIDKMKLSSHYKNENAGIYLNSYEAAVSKKMQMFIHMAETARSQCRALRISYKGMKDSSPCELVIHPYEILHYEFSYYCLAYSLKAKAFRNFKFSEERMKKMELMDVKFTRDLDFHVKDYIGQLGLMKNDVHEFEILITNQQALLTAERRIGIHPQMHWIDEHTLYLKTMMEGKMDVIAFILSLGENCQIVSPEQLKQEVAEVVKHMYQRYCDA